MFFIYLIIFLISIENILTTNNKSNSFLIIPSCQLNKTELKTIPISNNHQYYFYSSSLSSLSLASSFPFLPLLDLLYCEHQQTTSYSSSGFSILYSSPRLPLTDIQDKKHSSSFHHNVVHSAVDQSSSPTTNIITLMSSSSSNQNSILASNNMLSTTTMVTFLNDSSIKTTISYKGNQLFNMMLLIGCIISGILIMIITYLIIKYCKRDEGTYKIDESNTFPTKSSTFNSENTICTGKISTFTPHRQKLLPTNEYKLDNTKEWYV